ncbi:MAG TPA: LysE family translocator [Rhizobiales bacterium]|nr:LysE family translocator [Hyphomicrobiales bacterium]
MTIESAMSFTLAIFIFSITPGPGIFAILAKAMINGAHSCFMLSLGMTISDIVYLIAACFGLAALAHHWGELFTVVRLIGAAYLLYLGWKMWTARPNLTAQPQKETKSGMILSFGQGFLISASNPKVILFYIAFLPTFLDVESLSGRDIVIASVLTMFALMSGLMLVAYSASKARILLRTDVSARWINRIAGSIMIGAGAFLASRS